jgi:hypothetical protein
MSDGEFITLALWYMGAIVFLLGVTKLGDTLFGAKTSKRPASADPESKEG